MIAAETEKYAKIWEHPDYGNFSPGEQFVDLFLEQASKPERRRLVDLGCGIGRASLALQNAGFEVSCVDLVDSRTDKSLPFVKGSLWTSDWWGVPYDCGYCTDVLDHIPTEYVMLTLHRISQGCERCFFSISNVPDHFGSTIGQPLHLTVKPFVWWKQRIEESGGNILHARDLMTDSVFWVDYG